jgi:YD repeat-containing protein
MNPLKFSILILSASFVIACDKNDDVTPVDPPAAGIPKIKEVYETPDSSLSTYTYDDQGRVMKENYSDGGYTEYTYVDGYATETWLDGQGVLKGLLNYTLDVHGRCTSYTSSQYIYEYKVDYNEDNRISHILGTFPDGSKYDESYYTYEGGNLAKDSSYRYTNDSWTVITYEYYTYIKTTIGNKNFGILFWGEDNKNPYKKRTIIRSSNYNQYDNYGIPVLNEDGYIAQKLVTYGNGSFYMQEYTYY